MKFVFDNIFLIAAALVSGGMLLWPMINRSGGAGVGTLEATRMVNDRNALFLDVRSPNEFAAGHLPNARNIPVEDVEKRINDIPKDRPLVVYCATGQRAGKAAQALKAAGRDDVVCLNGGVGAWQQAGLPLIR